jgi:hypothetical protein
MDAARRRLADTGRVNDPPLLAMATRRHALMTICLLAGQLTPARGAGFDLVESGEAELERRHVQDLRDRMARLPPQGTPPAGAALPELDPDAPPLVTSSLYPTIRILSPTAAGDALKAPLRLELRFVAAPGSRIVPESFRALYGLLKLDITERLRRHAQVSESGVIAEHAMLPAGSHRLYLQVADDQGRFFERELRFRVEL